MNEETKRYHFKIQGTSPLETYRFVGLDEDKQLKEKSDREQAEARVYRAPNGNCALQGLNIRGCLREYLITQAPKGKKKETKEYVSPRIQVTPYLLDLGTRDYEINKRPVFSDFRGGVVAGYAVKPVWREWSVEGCIVTTLPKSAKELRRDFENAGVEVGTGSGKPLGFGRFTVTEFNEVTQ
jgi:hypothetical protein